MSGKRDGNNFDSPVQMDEHCVTCKGQYSDKFIYLLFRVSQQFMSTSFKHCFGKIHSYKFQINWLVE